MILTLMIIGTDGDGGGFRDSVGGDGGNSNSESNYDDNDGDRDKNKKENSPKSKTIQPCSMHQLVSPKNYPLL